MKIGVLALQGGYHKHFQTLDRIKIDHQTVRLPADLNSIDALIIPGGESTTIIKLIFSFGLFDSLQNFAKTKRFLLNLVKSKPPRGKKRSLRSNLKLVGWDLNYLVKLLFS